MIFWENMQESSFMSLQKSWLSKSLSIDIFKRDPIILVIFSQVASSRVQTKSLFGLS